MSGSQPARLLLVTCNIQYYVENTFLSAQSSAEGLSRFAIKTSVQLTMDMQQQKLAFFVTEHAIRVCITLFSFLYLANFLLPSE